MKVTKLLCMKIPFKDIEINVEGSMKMYCHNKTAINLFNNHVLHDETKHVEIHNFKEN